MAIEAINLKIANEIKNNKEKDFNKFQSNLLKLKKEKQEIYKGNKEFIEKVLSQY